VKDHPVLIVGIVSCLGHILW